MNLVVVDAEVGLAALVAEEGRLRDRLSDAEVIVVSGLAEVQSFRSGRGLRYGNAL